MCRAVPVRVNHGKSATIPRVRARVELYWTRQKQWFRGSVIACAEGAATASVVQVLYDDGDVCWHDMRSNTWRYVCGDGTASLPQQGIAPAPDLAVRLHDTDERATYEDGELGSSIKVFSTIHAYCGESFPKYPVLDSTAARILHSCTVRQRRGCRLALSRQGLLTRLQQDYPALHRELADEACISSRR